MTTNNPQPQPQPMQGQPMEQQPMEQQPMEQQPMEQQPMEETSEMEQGGQVEEQIENTPDRLILNWGVVYTFFK